jgi:NAD(P)H-nitrite reductase large subunit
MPGFRYVLIGTGVASLAAAQSIRQQDPQGEIRLVGDEAAGYYSRPGLAYYLNGEIPESLLFPMSKADWESLGVQRLQARVTCIDPQNRLVQLHDQSTLPYDRLLIATGARAVQLSLPGANLPGVVKLDNLEDAHRILQLARRGKTAVVVGGGITALEIAEALLARGVKTHYFLRGERYWSGVLDETESRLIEQRLAAHGLQIHFNTEIGEVLGRDSLSAVRTKDGRVVQCNLLAVAVGIKPRIELAQVSGLRADRGILVDEMMQTSAPGIYAAGDVAEVYDPILKKTILNSLWGPARRQGAIAGSNMAGSNTIIQKSTPFNVTRLADIPATIIGSLGGSRDLDLPGIARGDSETWRFPGESVAIQGKYEINRLRIMVGQHTLLGALVLGDQTPSRSLQQLIAGQVDITPIRDELLQPNRPISSILADFISSLA